MIPNVIDTQLAPSSRSPVASRTARGLSLLLVLCVSLGSIGCASMSRSQKAAAACTAADLATTAWGMAEGHSESNPTVADLDSWQIVLTNAVLHWGLHKLMNRVPRERAATFWSSYAAIRCGAALHNYDVIDSGREGGSEIE